MVRADSSHYRSIKCSCFFVLGNEDFWGEIGGDYHYFRADCRHSPFDFDWTGVTISDGLEGGKKAVGDK